MKTSPALQSKRPSAVVVLLVGALLLTSLDAQLGAPTRTPADSQPAHASTFVSPDVTATLILGIPTTITAPGLYRVTGDLTGVSGVDGITVDADHVILDLGGHTLSGADGTGCGIQLVNQREHFTLVNGTLTNWEDGTDIRGRSTVRNVTSVANTGKGFFLIRSLAEDLVSEDNGSTGIDLFDSCEARRCVSRDNGNAGINAVQSTLEDCESRAIAGRSAFVLSNSVAKNCEASGLSGRAGFFGGSSTLIDCRVSSYEVGFELFDAAVARNCEASGSDMVDFDIQGGRLEGCFALSFSPIGIMLGAGAVAVDCRVAQTVTVGIEVGESCVAERCVLAPQELACDPVAGDGIHALRGAVVRDCRVDGAIENGIVVLDDLTTVVGNRVHAAGAAGIVGGSNGLLSKNLVSDSVGPGITTAGDANRIEENSLRGNLCGLKVTGRDNLIIRNDAAGNGTAYALQFGNTRGPFINNQDFIQTSNPYGNFNLTF